MLLERSLEQAGNLLAIISEHTEGLALVMITKTHSGIEYIRIKGLASCGDRQAKGLVMLAAAEGMTLEEAERADMELDG